MVGERIRYYRKRQKMTLRELGEKSGFENRGDVRIAQYENGSRVPRTGTLNRIAKALGIPPEELFCFESTDFLQIRKAIRVAPEVDVLALHVVGPKIQPEILI